jgi:hypothetical protein
VVNDKAQLAWIGHPKDLDTVLEQIVNGSWRLEKARAERKFNYYLAALDDSLNYELMQYQGSSFKPNEFGEPNAGLLAIEQMVKKEPRLKYAPLMAFNTFSFLLKTDLIKAYEYGKVAIATATYDDPATDAIIAVIDMYSDKLKLPPDIYRLGAEAYQIEIDRIPYPELFTIHDYFDKMAAWYWRANDTTNAIRAQQRAIDALKNRGNFTPIKMNSFKSRLALYQRSI